MHINSTVTIRVDGDSRYISVIATVVYGDLSINLLHYPPIIEGIYTDTRKHIWARNLLLFLGLTIDRDRFVADGDRAIDFLANQRKKLPSTWKVFAPDKTLTIHESTVKSCTRIYTDIHNSEIDWLGCKVNFTCDNQPIDISDLRDCIKKGRKYVKLLSDSELKFAKIDNPEALLEILQLQEENEKFKISEIGKVKSILERSDIVHVPGIAQSLLEKPSNVVLPSKVIFKGVLRRYQQEGFNWLVFLQSHSLGGILADDMGLGKTVQVIALIAHLVSKNRKIRCLVVAPTTILGNWYQEILKFSPLLRPYIWHNNRNSSILTTVKHHVIITSYGLARTDDVLRKNDWTYVILDEAQYIKNPFSDISQTVKQYKSSYRLAITGTPIENRLNDLWSIFDFIQPGFLGPAKEFCTKYSHDINQLRELISPLILRRTKEQVAPELPTRTIVNRMVELTPLARSIYEEILTEARRAMSDENVSSSNILNMLLRLRQSVCDLRLLGLPREFKMTDNAKLMDLLELLRKLRSAGHRTLVFSQFTSMLQLIAQSLQSSFEFLSGETTNRQEIIKRWQTGKASVFLISLKAGGTGLNLTAADTIIHYDLWWNPAVENQASDRAHRIGQKRPVTIYRLLAANTIEEKVSLLQSQKQFLYNEMLEPRKILESVI